MSEFFNYDPRDHVDIEIANSDGDIYQPLDLAPIDRTGDPYTDRRKEEYRHQLQQSAARGLISPNQAIEAWEQDDRGAVAKALEATVGIKGTESGLQTFVDVLSLGNYAMAALSKARYESIRDASLDYKDGEVPWYDHRRWLPVFSPSSFKKHFQDRTMYADVFGEEYGLTAGGIGSFVVDVALDPLTYLTLGTGVGAKVGLKAGSQAGAKVGGVAATRAAAGEAAELTLTRWGTRVHKEAIKDLLPQVEKEIAEEVAEGSTLAATRQRQLLNDRAAEHMIENYPDLARRAWEGDRRMATKGRRAIGDMATGQKTFPIAQEMFTETVPLHLKEMGVSGARIRRILEAIPHDKYYGNYFHNTIKIFNKTWGMDANSRQLFTVMQDTVNNERRQWTRQIAEDFKGLTDDEARTVTDILEHSVNKKARNAVDIMDMDYAPHLLDAAAKAKSIFDDIAREEQKYGILGDTVDNYVTHLFKGDDAKLALFNKVRDEKGWAATGSPYSIHRQIASISDLKGLMPDDVVEDNIYKILMRRKLMSINTVNRQKFYLEMQATYGFPKALIAMASESVPAAIRKRMMETRDSIADVSDMTQWFAEGGVRTAKWGFKEGDKKRNMDVLEWLTTGRAARGNDAPWLTDHLRNYTKTIKSKFDTKIQGETLNIDAMKAIRGIMTGDPFDRVPMKRAMEAIGKFDNELRKSGAGPLFALVPELEPLMRSGLRKPAKPPKYYKDFVDKMKSPVTGLKKETQLPEDLVTRAIQFRKSMGILTDVTKPMQATMDDISEMLTGVGKRGFGFKPKETEQLLDVMFDKKTLGQLTAKEADRLQNFLSLHHGDRAALPRYMKMTGEPMVEVFFSGPQGLRVSSVATNLERVKGGFKETIENLKGRSGDLTQTLGKYTKKISNLRSAEEQVGKINGQISREVARRKGLTKNSPEYLASLERGKKLKQSKEVLEKKYGTVSSIRAEIKRQKRLGDPVKKAAKERGREIAIMKKRMKVADDHSAYLKDPTNKKLKKKYEKSLAQLRRMAADDTIESGVSEVTKARKFEPGDPRLVEDLARASEDVVGPGMKISRKEGTFGPFVSEPGERILSAQAQSYYLPKSVAALIEDVNKTLYGNELGWLMRKYDALQNMFKAPLMAVWPEFYMRNAVTNVALTYLKSGAAMINPTYQANFLKILTYTLSKEAIDITNLPKSQAAFMAYAGGTAGGIVGAYQEHQATDSGLIGSVLSGRALAGALGGTVGGAAIGGGTGVAMRAGLQNVAKGGVAAQTVAGGTAGALAAGEGNRAEGFVGGAAIGAGATRLALGDGYRNLDKLAKQKIKLANGKELTVAEMVHEAGRRGVFSTYVNEEIFKQGGSKILAMGERNGLKPNPGWQEALKPHNAVFARDSFRAGELASEIPTRLMLFSIEAQRTGSLGQAARAVKDYLFDYAGLSTVERRVIKRWMPFYTWTKHAMLTSADSIIQNPGRVAHQYKFIHNQNKHIDADPADYPDWLVDRLKRVKVVYNPQTGEKELEVKSGYGFVQEDTMALWKEATGGDPSKLLARGPFGATAALEGMIDKDFFRGSHIKSQLYKRSSFESARAYKDAPPWLREAVGYRVDPSTGRERVDPRAAWLMSEVPVSRLLNVSKKIYNSEEGEYNYIALARQVLGEKSYKYGPDQKLYHDKAKLDRMASFLKNIGQVKTMQRARTVDSPYKPPKINYGSIYR